MHLGLRKAAARKNCDDNYIFCPIAVDTQRANSTCFQLLLSKSEQVVVTYGPDKALLLSWESMVMLSVFRQIKKVVDVLNCSNWCKHVLGFYRVYIGYGFPKELRRGDSVTKLHYV